MDGWINENAVVLAAAAAVLFVVAVVFVIAWVVASARHRRANTRRIAADRSRIETELALAEQTARLRMIRELHEVAVHDVSIIISQADGAQYAAHADPSAAVRAASIIGESARNTLADLRRVMSVVGDNGVASDVQPDVADVSELVRVMRESGLDIQFSESGAAFDMKPGAGLTIYRIIQEALANSLKHGGAGTRVSLALTWTDESLQVKVEDDGARNAIRLAGGDPNKESRARGYNMTEDLNALTASVTGAGMTEMRERAELFGGVFSAVPLPGVGFSVAVAFPHLRFHNGVHGVNLES